MRKDNREGGNDPVFSISSSFSPQSQPNYYRPLGLAEVLDEVHDPNG